jgi:RimJ/RimL family protein N-acetyltransferase
MIVSDPDVRHFWRTRGSYWAPYQVQAQLGRDVLVSAVATTRGSADDVIGLVELIDPSFVDARAQLSLVVANQYLSTGIGVEIALLFLDFTFSAYPFDKICIEVHSNNERLTPGLRRHLDHEGTLKRHLNIHGSWYDVDVFALWRSELPPLMSRLLGRHGAVQSNGGEAR